MTPFVNASGASLYALAGRAVFTLKSRASGRHFTYKVEVTKNNARRWFVSIKDQERFRYLGMLIDMDNSFQLSLTNKSAFFRPTQPVLAFDWFAQHVLSRNVIPDTLEVWHEGQCGRCGRALTDPQSIELGIGPECAHVMGLR